jgi:flagellar basal body-associated protein FliL
MANGPTIKTYSALDIEKYQKGLLSPAEMHAMEKAALEDPFLADAMEGYTDAGTSLQADLSDLRNRLAQRTEEKTKVIPIGSTGKSSFPWMRAAIMIGVLTGAGVLAYFLMFNEPKNEIAQVKNTPVPVSTVTDTGKATTQGTVVAADNQFSNLTTNTKSDSSTRDKVSYYTTATSDAKQKTEAVIAQQAEAKAVQTEVVNEEAKDLEKKAKWESDRLAKERNQARAAEKADDNTAKKATAGNGYTAAVPVAAEQAKNKAIAPAPARKMEDNNFYKSNIFRGRVTDGMNFGVPFAKVTNTEDNVGTYTDAHGYFNLTSPDSVLNVQIRSIGYENSNTQLKNSLPNNQVVLQNDSRSLNAFVINNQRPNASRRADNNTVKLEEPVPADGWDNYDTYLTNNLVVPDEYRGKPNSTGITSVEVSFEVDAKGEPINIRVEKSLCDKCDKEAIRLIREGPKWKRAARNGRTTVTIPFNQLF